MMTEDLYLKPPHHIKSFGGRKNLNFNFDFWVLAAPRMFLIGGKLLHCHYFNYSRFNVWNKEFISLPVLPFSWYILSSESDSLASGGWDNATTAFLHDLHFWTLFSSCRKSSFNSNYKTLWLQVIMKHKLSTIYWDLLKELHININMEF